MHFCSDGRTGIRKSQVDGPIIRGTELARVEIEVVTVSIQDIVSVDDVAQLAREAEETRMRRHPYNL
jgi:hypothetical protein